MKLEPKRLFLYSFTIASLGLGGLALSEANKAQAIQPTGACCDHSSQCATGTFCTDANTVGLKPCSTQHDGYCVTL